MKETKGPYTKGGGLVEKKLAARVQGNQVQRRDGGMAKNCLLGGGRAGFGRNQGKGGGGGQSNLGDEAANSPGCWAFERPKVNKPWQAGNWVEQKNLLPR